MALSIPTIELPWQRKTPLQRAQAELHKIQKEAQKVQKDVEARVDKSDLPKVKADDIGAAVEETAKAAAHGIEQVAGQVAVAAGKFGRKAGKVSREAGKRGRRLSRELAATGEESVGKLSGDLAGLTRDVRSLRVTREKQGPNMIPGIALLAGLGGGMAVMYFFDPEQGNRRRALLRDQLIKWTRVTGETIEGKSKDLRNRGMGLAHEVRRAVDGGGDAIGDDLTQAIDAVDVSGVVAESTPNVASDLDAVDQAGGRRSGRGRTSAGGAATGGAGAGAAVGTAEVGTSRPITEPAVETTPTESGRENIYGAFGEVAAETWGDTPTVPEGTEGQPDLRREG